MKAEIVQDTLLLDEEIVNVEVWTYDEPRLYDGDQKVFAPVPSCRN